MEIVSFWQKTPNHCKETFTFLSETVPDQSLSVKQLLEKYTRGIVDPRSMENPNYYYDEDLGLDEETIDRFDSFEDVFDTLDFIHENRKNIENGHKQVEEDLKRHRERSDAHSEAPSDLQEEG